MSPSAFQVLCKCLLRKEFLTHYSLSTHHHISILDNQGPIRASERFSDRMNFTFTLCIVDKIPSIRKFHGTPIISKNLQSPYKGFSEGFQSISPQSSYKVIRNSFLSKHLESTLKVLDGIGGVYGLYTCRHFSSRLNLLWSTLLLVNQ